MIADGFTTEAYVDLLDAAEDGGYDFLTVADYLAALAENRQVRSFLLS